MILNHEEFLKAIHETRKIKVVFFSDEDNSYIERTCAPMDYGVGIRINDNISRYWVWDYDSDTRNHPLGLKEEKIRSLHLLSETFDPAEFVTWEPNWHVSRQWGAFS